MFLRAPSWADDSLRSSSAASSSASSHGAAQAPIVDLVLSLTNQRLYREVSLSLRTGLRDVKAEFSFMRVRGLKSLTRFLTSAVKSEKIVELFLDTQKYRELQGNAKLSTFNRLLWGFVLVEKFTSTWKLIHRNIFHQIYRSDSTILDESISAGRPSLVFKCKQLSRGCK